jgi:RNA polymerase sigma-70 factor (ECF subfamily)
MDGDRLQEEAVLAAAKTLKPAENNDHGAETEVALKLSDSVADPLLETLFQEHHERVFRAAWRVTGSASDAEDVLQIVFLRLLRSGEGGSELGDWSEHPERYLSRAAINAALDVLRRRKSSRFVGLDEVGQKTMRCSGRSPQESEEDRELRKLIREAVSRLGEKAAEMFALRYFEGYDNGEIARMMGTSTLVVGVTLHRARAKLRKEIGRYLRSQTR